MGQRKTGIGQQLWWNWDLDRSHYPNWEQLVQDFAAEGIAVGLYINPFLVELPPEVVSASGQSRRQLYHEAAAQGFLVRDQTGEIYRVQNTDFSAGLVDLSNPGVRDWFEAVIQTELLGIVGFLPERAFYGHRVLQPLWGWEIRM